MGQFSIDNLKIENLDENPNVIQTEFKSGKWVTPEDAVYEPMERVYADAESGQESNGLSWYFLIPAAAVVGAVALGITAVVIQCKAKKQKGVAEDEN